MRQARLTKFAKAVAVVLSVLSLSGCIVVRDSPAPGCVQTIGFSGFGSRRPGRRSKGCDVQRGAEAPGEDDLQAFLNEV